MTGNKNINYHRSNLEPRVASLEGRMEQLVQTVDRMARSIEKRDEVLFKKLDSLVERQIQNFKPDWRTLISAAGLIIVLITAIGSAWIIPINNEIRNLDRIVEKYYTEYVSNRTNVNSLLLDHHTDIEVLKNNDSWIIDKFKKPPD